jgi:hypothetical protein
MGRDAMLRRYYKPTGTEIYVGAGNMTVREAYDAYKNGDLTKFR